jgi:hypothetical protein
MGAGGKTCTDDKDGAWHTKCLRATNFVNALACGLIGLRGVFYYFKNINDSDEDDDDWKFAGIFLSLYAIAFSFFLCFFEAGRKSSSTFLRENFGFMYNFCGRASFLLFISILLFDRSTFGDEGLVVGIITCINAAYQIFLVNTHKDITYSTMIDYSAQ